MNRPGTKLWSFGFGDITEQVDATGIGGPAMLDVQLPDNWFELSVVQQEAWLKSSSYPANVAALIEDQQSVGPGPMYGAPQKVIQTPFGPVNQSSLLLYGGLGVVALIALVVVTK